MNKLLSKSLFLSSWQFLCPNRKPLVSRPRGRRYGMSLQVNSETLDGLFSVQNSNRQIHTQSKKKFLETLESVCLHSVAGLFIVRLRNRQHSLLSETIVMNVNSINCHWYCDATENIHEIVCGQRTSVHGLRHRKSYRYSSVVPLNDSFHNLPQLIVIAVWERTSG